MVEDLDAGGQGPVILLVQLLHHQLGKEFMVDLTDNGVLQGMGKGAVADIMQQDGEDRSQPFFLVDLVPFLTKDIEGFLHQVHGTQGMMKAGMQGSGVDKVGEPQLLYAPQALEPRVLDQVKDQVGGDVDEPVHRVIDDFSLIESQVLQGVVLCKFSIIRCSHCIFCRKIDAGVPVIGLIFESEQ